MGRLDNKVAFVTGAARGQGRSHCVRMAEEGADIIAIDICDELPFVGYDPSTLADLEETARQVEALDRRIIFAKADVRDEPALKQIVADGVAELGRLDIVAAQAGIGPVAQLTEELDPAEWQAMLDINLTGVWNAARASIPHLVAGGRGGAIVITSSLAAIKGYRGLGHYAAAKSGLSGLARSMAIELGPHSIRVTCIAPTQVGTPMLLNQATYDVFAPDKVPHATQEDLARVSQSLHLLPTPWVEAVDISNALVFLASDEARYITAITLPVDAGTSQY